MTLEELSDDRKDELRCTVYFALDTIPGNEELTQEDLNKINRSECAAAIPYEILEKLYGGINFVDEDFCCA